MTARRCLAREHLFSSRRMPPFAFAFYWSGRQQTTASDFCGRERRGYRGGMTAAWQAVHLPSARFVCKPGRVIWHGAFPTIALRTLASCARRRAAYGAFVPAPTTAHPQQGNKVRRNFRGASADAGAAATQVRADGRAHCCSRHGRRNVGRRDGFSRGKRRRRNTFCLYRQHGVAGCGRPTLRLAFVTGCCSL